VQQGDLRIGAFHVQIVALREITDRRAVASHLCPRFEAIGHAQLNLAAGAYHDGAVAQGVRANGSEHPHVQIRLDDGAAAGQRIGGRAGGGGDHDAIAAVRVDEPAVDGGLEVHGAARFPLVHHHVIEGQRANRRRAGMFQARRQQRAAILAVAAIQHRIDILEHRIGADIGQKSQPPAVDAQQRHAMRGDQARRVQQRAVAADGDDEIGTGREGGFRAGYDAVGLECQADSRIDQDAHAAGVDMRSKAQHAFGDAQVGGVADQRYGLKRVGHAYSL